MCGLFGVISSVLTKGEIELFQDLATVSTLRGTYGSGVVAVPSDTRSKIEVLKHADLTAAELVRSGEFLTISNRPTTMLMGHARLPTAGGWDFEDAHPHVVESIIGMHNGTLSHLCGGKVRVGKKDPSDSFQLFDAISRLGAEKVIPTLVGSYAMTYIDKKQELLYFIRNNDRPLYWAKVGVYNTLYWASEADFLTLVLSRKHKTQEIIIYNSRPDTLTAFDIRPYGLVKSKDPVILRQKTEVSVPSVQSEAMRRANERDDKSTDQFGRDIPEPQEGKTRYITFGHQSVPYYTLRATLTKGCACCTQQASVSDYMKKRITWIKADEFLCNHCLETQQVARDAALSCGVLIPEPKPPLTH